MNAAADFIAVDWGTTNRRIYLIGSDGSVLARSHDNRGMRSIAAGTFGAAAAAIRAQFGDWPLVCAGMIGARGGWMEAPYCPCPASIADLTAQAVRPEPGCAIVPGVCDLRGDVMRGEEVQVLGAAAAGLIDGDAVVCQPGTHCKWITLSGGRIAGLATMMTGEMFALLRDHSVLADFLGDTVADGPAFRQGLRDGLAGHCLSRLFSIRARALLGIDDRASDSSGNGAARASGLLIGADIAAQALDPARPVHLVADPALGALYQAGLAEA
eukprot:gene6449-6516_t